MADSEEYAAKKIRDLSFENERLAGLLATVMRPKEIIIQGNRYEIRPLEDGTVDIIWLGTTEPQSPENSR